MPVPYARMTGFCFWMTTSVLRQRRRSSSTRSFARRAPTSTDCRSAIIFSAVHDEGAYYWLERQTRLFRKGTLEFSPTVHGGFVNLSEKVYDVPAESGVAMMHLSHANVAQWIEKTNRYTSQSDRVRMPDEGRDLVAFAHRSIEKWTARRLVDRPGSYPEAVGLLRSIYDLIDRLKTWEEERGVRR